MHEFKKNHLNQAPLDRIGLQSDRRPYTKNSCTWDESALA